MNTTLSSIIANASSVSLDQLAPNVTLDVSVIVPVFNCEAYIGALLQSLLTQKGVSFEVIAVSDGSTDDSLAIMKMVAAEDPRLIVIDQVNSGPSVARNTGLALARGEWVMFADGDDLVRTGMLHKLIKQGRDTGADMVLGNGIGFNQTPDFETDTRLLSKQRKRRPKASCQPRISCGRVSNGGMPVVPI